MGTTQLIAAGVGVGNEVVVPSYGGAEVAEAVREIGARPVFADIDARSYCLDPVSVEQVVSECTAAVVPVHLFGHCADLNGLGELAALRNIRVVEWEPLPRVDAVDAVRRRQHAEYLGRRLRGVVTPVVEPGVEHAFMEYVVRVPGNGRPDRDAFKRALRARGVECGVPVKLPAHRMPEFRAAVRLPEAERAADECLALPLAASLTKRELQHVISACNGLGGLLRERAS
ncbi:DegT/DnrJ/EryC1/StrS family aminotransferase [Streptomyces iconiensis]|uniref:DegT/DnrJ/EryC1/StrS family aminotransferase n=1 Tax=Streptomyces iconiensis TaxID=1384038 RepID=A0ABT6ZPF8_9ACTN|nr:DegT/DnrJ/EryC1/StrS family aminotransferase [Streptomyces iconiensis]MDJ1130941.1 DegT/DnrJ/EryC1/StrS family aminotransferase [Streptomyces iconiensis]